MYKKILVKKNVLLLQGPVGKFFYEFAQFLTKNKTNVYKINFHLGEQFFYNKNNASFYKGNLLSWPQYLKTFIITNNIQQIYLVGSHKSYHEIAIKIANEFNIEIYVFEEGYIRPNFISIEKNGVNSKSFLSKDISQYLTFESDSDLVNIQYDPQTSNLQQQINIWKSYYFYAWGLFITQFYNPNYEHHLDFKGLKQFIKWSKVCFMLSFVKPILFKKFNISWVINNSKNFYFVALQINTDSAIKNHSEKYIDVNEFVKDTIISFAKYAPKDSKLLIKHHPNDLGLHSYAKLINTLAKNYEVKSRVKYIHTIHLPTALDNAKGCIVINSTLGLSALSHAIPTISLSKQTIYNLPGLTNQCSLDEFWNRLEKPDYLLYNKFIQYTIYHTQIKGNFHNNMKTDFEQKFIFE